MNKKECIKCPVEEIISIGYEIIRKLEHSNIYIVRSEKNKPTYQLINGTTGQVILDSVLGWQEIQQHGCTISTKDSTHIVYYNSTDEIISRVGRYHYNCSIGNLDLFYSGFDYPLPVKVIIINYTTSEIVYEGKASNVILSNDKTELKILQEFIY